MRSSVMMQAKAPIVFGLKPAKMDPTRTMTMMKADQTSGRRQVEKWVTHANRKDMASWQRLTGISYSKRKEVDWYTSFQRTRHQESENIDWRRAVAAQHELQTTCKELLTEFEDTNSGRKSESPTMGEDTMLSDLQLKQYWSEVLVSSILDVKTKKADLEAGIAVGKKPGYHK
jgi:hypothetical protein